MSDYTQSDIDALEDRISELEGQIEDRDDTICEIKNELIDAEALRDAVEAYLEALHRSPPSLTPEAWAQYERQYREELIAACWGDGCTAGRLLYVPAFGTGRCA